MPASLPSAFSLTGSPYVAQVGLDLLGHSWLKCMHFSGANI